MQQLLTEAFRRLEGRSQNTSGAFLLSSRLQAITGLFSQFPDTLEDVWVAAALHDEEQARQIIDAVPEVHPFRVRNDTIDTIDWESCSVVLDAQAQLERLRQSWCAAPTMNSCYPLLRPPLVARH